MFADRNSWSTLDRTRKSQWAIKRHREWAGEVWVELGTLGVAIGFDVCPDEVAMRVSRFVAGPTPRVPPFTHQH